MYALKRVRWTVLLFCRFFPNYHGSVPQKIHVKCNFSHMEKVKLYESIHGVPTIRNASFFFFFNLAKITEWSTKLRGYKRLVSLLSLRTPQSNATNHFVVLPTKQFADSINWTSHHLLGHLIFRPVWVATGFPSVSSVSHTTPLLLPNPQNHLLCALPWTAELANAKIWPISVVLGEYSQPWTFQDTILKRTNGKLSTWGWYCGIKRRYTT